jgi:ATP-binding cassette, subfamily C (CFTR/MRP), member 1
MTTTILPRAAKIGLAYAQTFLIAAAIKYLETPIASREKNHGYGLIGATVLIYFGLTVGWRS